MGDTQEQTITSPASFPIHSGVQVKHANGKIARLPKTLWQPINLILDISARCSTKCCFLYQLFKYPQKSCACPKKPPI